MSVSKVSLTSQQVARERLRMVYQQAPHVTILGLALALLIGVFFTRQISWVALGWLSVMLALSVTRVVARRLFKLSARQAGHWPMTFVVLVALEGLAWGGGGVIALVGLETPLGLLSLIFIVGVTGVTVALYANQLAAVGAFLIGALAPSTFTLAWLGSELNIAAAVLLLIYGIALWYTATQLNQNYRLSLELRFENENLARDLRLANRQLKTTNQDLERLSFTDGLTQISNRYFFERRYVQEWQRGLRERSPLGLVLIDIDQFKEYNDHYGHLAGDECLRKVASAINLALMRPVDLLARYGGEEFVVLLPNTPLEGALNVAGEIRKAVEQLGLAHATSTVRDQITVSMGVAAVIPSAAMDQAQLLETADLALYQSKNSGRDRITMGDAVLQEMASDNLSTAKS